MRPFLPPLRHEISVFPLLFSLFLYATAQQDEILSDSNENLVQNVTINHISAAIHDYDHPGLNNSFLINTGDQLALAYNDQSPLENHHVAMAFVAMGDDSCKITKNFQIDDQKKFRKICISTVLATDMAKNFHQYLKKKTNQTLLKQIRQDVTMGF